MGQQHLYCDSDGAIKLAENPIITNNSRHIELRYHYIRERIEKNEVVLTPIKGHDNTADILTKPLGSTLFKKHRNELFKNCM